MTIAYQLLAGPGPSTSLMQAWTDLSAFVKSVDTQRGRSTELDDIQAGTAKVVLDNESGILTPARSLSDELMPPNVNTGGDALGNTTGWAAIGGSSIVGLKTGNPHSGTESVQYQVTTASNLNDPIVITATSPTWGISNPYLVKVTPNATYQANCWIRLTNSGGFSNLTLQLAVRWADSSGNDIGVTNLSTPIALTIAGPWTLFAGSATAPAGAYSAFLVAYNGTGGVSTLVHVDDWSWKRVYPYTALLVPDTPVRVGTIQGGNLMPYQMANVDHWHDQVNGDIESLGLWHFFNPYLTDVNGSTGPSYDSVNGGLSFGHAAGQTAGSRAYICNEQRARISWLPAGTYRFTCQVKGITFGAGATIGAKAVQVNYATARSTPTTVATTTSTLLPLTTGTQTFTFTFTVTAQSSGLTAVIFELFTDMVGTTLSTVVASAFQLTAGTAAAPAFTAGDAYYPDFAGFADTWTAVPAGANDAVTELDATDQLRWLGNQDVDLPYPSMIRNSASTMYYYPFSDTAANVIASGVADAGASLTNMSLLVATSNDAQSYGIQAGAADLLAVTTGTNSVHPGTVVGVGGIQPNYSPQNQAGTSFKWTAGNVGNCGSTSGKSQYPVTTALNALLPAVGASASGTGSFDCWIELDTMTSGVRECSLLGSNPSSGSNAGWHLNMTFNNSGSSMTVDIGYGGASHTLSVTNLFDGNSHHVAFQWTITGSTIAWSLWFDGTSVLTGSDPYSAVANQSVVIGAAQLSAGVLYNPWIGRIAHVTIGSGPIDVAARVAMGRASFGTGEQGRIQALMLAAGTDVFTDSHDASMVTLGWTSWSSGTVASDALKGAAADAGGIFVIGRTGNPTYQNVNHATETTRVVFQNSDGSSIDPGAQFYVEHDHIINSAVVTLANGTVVRAQDWTSIRARGVYVLTLSVSHSTTSVGQSIANNAVNLHGEPLTRVTGIRFTCVNGVVASRALNLEVGCRVQLAGLPSTAPSGVMNFIVQQVSVSGNYDEGGATAPVVAVELSPDLS